jgi:hypothetical protein
VRPTYNDLNRWIFPFGCCSSKSLISMYLISLASFHCDTFSSNRFVGSFFYNPFAREKANQCIKHKIHLHQKKHSCGTSQLTEIYPQIISIPNLFSQSHDITPIGAGEDRSITIYQIWWIKLFINCPLCWNET